MDFKFLAGAADLFPPQTRKEIESAEASEAHKKRKRKTELVAVMRPLVASMRDAFEHHILNGTHMPIYHTPVNCFFAECGRASANTIWCSIVYSGTSPGDKLHPDNMDATVTYVAQRAVEFRHDDDGEAGKARATPYYWDPIKSGSSAPPYLSRARHQQVPSP